MTSNISTKVKGYLYDLADATHSLSTQRKPCAQTMDYMQKTADQIKSLGYVANLGTPHLQKDVTDLARYTL